MKFACSSKCGAIKKSENNLEKYGVDNTAKLESTKLKYKKTCLEKYGYDSHNSCKTIKENKCKNNLR
jgi:hypothetical protein